MVVNKKILVLMSTFNGEEFLREQIDSILAQNGVEVNLLIRDDGSLDNTHKIISEYKNNIKFIKGTNIGAAQSFFTLIDKAELDYDYYAFSDQDDVWLEDKLFNAVERLDKFSQQLPSLYYSGQILADKNLNIIGQHYLNTKRSLFANFIFNQMAGCTAVFNRKALEILKRYHPHQVYMHDAWVYKVCAAVGANIVVDRKSYILYRQHESNVIGYNNGLKGKVKQIEPHLKNKPSLYAEQIINAYGNDISKEWKDFLNILIENKKIKSRVYLLLSNKIKFNDFQTRLVYNLKTLFYNF